jgi:folate-binding protein YgfZ
MLSPDQIRQYTDVREGAALIDRHHRGRIVARGSDRKSFLQALLTNDILALGADSGCYAALLTSQGRMVTDMRVFELGDATLLDVPGAVKDTLLATLDQMIFSEDVQLADLTDELGCVSVQGPMAAAAVGRALGGEPSNGPAALTGDGSITCVRRPDSTAMAGDETDGRDLAKWPAFHHRRIDLGGEVGILARVDEFGLPGFLLFAPPNRLPALAAAISAAGAIVPDAQVVETLRVEFGTPLFLVDMTDDTIPLEAGIEAQAISSTKGCYPGQEVIVRIRDRGHGRVVRKLVGLAIDGDTEPAPGDRLLVDGKDVGHVTSAAHSPALGKPIALGYVHRDHVTPGSRVAISHGDARLAATVTALPFVGQS